ncbi:MAG: alpha/beta fold hydrolase [Deltaproteobacteria bacterium]|nr:alpha/beta fold hydrolase [Deltaproteobacteria bacterium]
MFKTPEWFFLERGQGRPLLLLHGLGACSFSWRANLEPLSAHYRVLAPDLPPHGRTGLTPGADYRLEALADGVLAFMDSRDVDQAAVAGNSLGGSLALLLARHHPERVAALILLAPAAALTRVPLIFRPLRLPGLGLLAAALLGPWMLPLALRLMYHRRELVTPEVVAGYAPTFETMARRLALRRLARQLELWPLSKVELLLEEIKQPVTIIWGKEDRILPVRQADFLKRHLPQADLYVLPQVGHAPQEEAPDAVNEIIIAFLARTLKNQRQEIYSKQEGDGELSGPDKG